VLAPAAVWPNRHTAVKIKQRMKMSLSETDQQVKRSAFRGDPRPIKFVRLM
jgi:hypothetical protein